MKHIIRILVLIVAIFTGLTTVSAQSVHVDVRQKVRTLPSTATNYLDDPFRYFDITLIVTGAGNEGLDVFFDIDFSLNDNSFYIRTKPGSVPRQPIHISEGINSMKRDDMLDQLRGGRKDTNVDFTKPMSAQLLPEGTYQLCLDVFLWSDRVNPERQPISDNYCPSYDICYSGSAPELVSPLAGAQMALNGTMVVAPSRKINFLWTPVISNCADNSTRFKYKLKVVKVLNGQNYRDAIKYNPTVFSTEVGNKTYAVFDTLRDIKVQMERGALYVAQVQAEQMQTTRNMDAFIVANGGNSQPMPFFWAIDGSSLYGYIVNEDEEGKTSERSDGLTQWEGGVQEVSELETIVDEMKEQYLAGFIQDAATIASLTEVYPEERQYVPTPKRHYVESDGYYTVPMTDDLEVSFMPARHESLEKVSYTIEVYDYISGGVDSITAYEPLLREVIEEVPDRYNKMDSHELINRTLTGWGAAMEQGSLYYLQLSSSFTVGYWEYAIADTLFYVNEMLAEHIHDTISRDFMEDEFMYSNGVYFQWGDDPETPDFKTPQWKAPVNRIGDDIYDPMNYVLPASVPEIQKGNTFPVSWAPVKGVTQGDEVAYEVNVYELKPGQTLEEAILRNEAIATRTIINDNEISVNDEKFFKAFSPKKTYVMTLSTNVYGESDTFYHFENGNEALPIVFKIVK